jgi:predicted Zn-dependent protease
MSLEYCEVCKKTITEEFKKELLKVDLQPEQYCEVCKIIEKIIHNL